MFCRSCRERILALGGIIPEASRTRTADRRPWPAASSGAERWVVEGILADSRNGFIQDIVTGVLSASLVFSGNLQDDKQAEILPDIVLPQRRLQTKRKDFKPRVNTECLVTSE